MFANELVLVETQSSRVFRPATLSFVPLLRGVLNVHLADVVRVPFAQYASGKLTLNRRS